MTTGNPNVGLYMKCMTCNDMHSTLLMKKISFCSRCGTKLEFWKLTATCAADPSHETWARSKFCEACGSTVHVTEEKVE